MAKKIDYASMFTLRKDGRYMGYAMPPNAKNRKAIYDKDPETLYWKIKELEKPKVKTFGEVAEEWRNQWDAQKLGEGSQSSYNAPFKQMVSVHRAYALEAVTAAEVSRVMLTEQAKGYSYKHAAAVLSMYKQTFKFAIIRGYTLYNPALSVTVPRHMTRTTREAPEDDVILIIKNNVDKPFGLFAYFLIYTGFRAGEAIGLKWSDIDRKNKMIKCERSVERLSGKPHTKDPKTKAGFRSVPLLDDLAEVLVKPTSAKNSNYVFLNDNGGLFTSSQLRAKWTAWGKDVGLTEIKTTTIKNRKTGETRKKTYSHTTLNQHQLRHGYCTILYEAGIDELTAMELMGHANIATTRAIYTHLRQSRREGVADILNKQFSSIVVKPVVNSEETVENTMVL